MYFRHIIHWPQPRFSMESVLCSLFWKGYPLGDIRPLSGKHLLFTLEALDDPVCGAAESDALRSTTNQIIVCEIGTCWTIV